MTHKFPSEEWTAAYKDAVNANEAYRTAGKDWTFGSVAMVVEATPDLGLDRDSCMLLDVHQGRCNGTTHSYGVDTVKDAPFIIVASYERWREVLEGKVDPIMGMMQGKLRLTQGHLPTMLRFVESSRQLVVSATHVPTEFRNG